MQDLTPIQLFLAVNAYLILAHAYRLVAFPVPTLDGLQKAAETESVAASDYPKERLEVLREQNKLVEGGLMIGDHEVDLKNLKLPVLNIFAEQDHLVPPAASKIR